MDAFKSFGDIEAAAIAPCNRGFGELVPFVMETIQPLHI